MEILWNKKRSKFILPFTTLVMLGNTVYFYANILLWKYFQMSWEDTINYNTTFALHNKCKNDAIERSIECPLSKMARDNGDLLSRWHFNNFSSQKQTNWNLNLKLHFFYLSFIISIQCKVKVCVCACVRVCVCVFVCVGR